MKQVKKLFTVFLAVIFTCSVLLVNVQASSSYLYVNGENILTDSDGIIECGSGSAVYDSSTNSLTLNNVLIDTVYNPRSNAAGIYVAGIPLLHIEVVGTNTIASSASQDLKIGILSENSLVIDGTGSLNITTSTSSLSTLVHAIEAKNDLTISNITLHSNDKTTSSYRSNVKSALFVSGTTSPVNNTMTINNAQITVDNYESAIAFASGSASILNSTMKATNASRGIDGDGIDVTLNNSNFSVTASGYNSGGIFSDTLDVDDSTVSIIDNGIVEGNGIFTDGQMTFTNSVINSNSYYPALFSYSDILIEDSEVNATSSDDSAIFTPNELFIKGDSKVKTNGFYPGIFVNGLTVAGGSVEATSSDDIAIFTRGFINITGGSISASGVNHAIAVQSNEGQALSKFSIDSSYQNTSNATLRSSTDGNLAYYVDEFSNPVPTLQLQFVEANYDAVNSAISNIPTDLSQYTTKSVEPLINAKNAVIYSKGISEQAIVDAYATSINNALKALDYKEADYSNVDALLASIPSDLSQYKKQSVDALLIIKDAVVRGKKINEQAVVDKYANDLEMALNNLKANEKQLQNISFPELNIYRNLSDKTFTYVPLGANTTVEYTSSNPKVATVSSDGKVTMVGAGTAIIHARALGDDNYYEGFALYMVSVNAVIESTNKDYTIYFDAYNDYLDSIEINGNKLTILPTGKLTDTITGTVIGEMFEGSIGVTLYSDYLASMPAGDIIVQIHTNTNYNFVEQVTLTIPKEPAIILPEPEVVLPTKVPITSDNTNIVLYTSLLLATATFITITCLKGNRQSNK